MKKGFTLIELMIVIIIIGILATIGIVQYQAAVEKSRGSEAKQFLGFLRSSCAARWMEDGDTTHCDNGNMSIGTQNSQLPGNALANCRSSHFFYYDIPTHTGNSATFKATRCTTAGKTPTGTMPAGSNVTLVTVYDTGADTWTTSGQW